MGILDNAMPNGQLDYHYLIATTSEGFWFIDTDYKTIEVNDSLCLMLGYTREEMFGMSVLEFVVEDHIKILRSSLVSMAEKNHRSYEVALYRKNGERIDCQFNATSVRDNAGQLVGSFAFITDISERKRAEEELKSSQRQLADIIDFLPDATLVIDKEGHVIAWNREVEKMTGYKAEEMLGKGDYEYSKAFYQGEKRPIIIDLVLLPQEEIEKEYVMLSRDGDILIGESKVTVVRGENRRLSAWARPIYDASGNIVGAIECIRDVTELEEYRMHLEEMIESRTEELKNAKDAAESAARAKSDFLANMSHEIRTPMNAIIGFSNLALKTELTAKQYDYIKKIEISAKSLLGIINDILDFSKIEAGRMELEKIDFRLDDVVNNIVNMITVEGEKKGLEILSDIAGDVPHALIGDPLRLGQVLTNLANNAVKFTEQGSILIKAQLVEKDADECVIQFSIKDTGIGMTKSQMEKLFTAFTQADTSVTRRFGGTGLGLTISKHLVEMMDGEIVVESTPGEGSTFSFTARLARQQEANELKLQAPDDMKGLKVLIVDDNDIAREVLTEQIRSFHFEANSVASGREAIQELKRSSGGRPYDLVLMDWKMPEMDGIDAAEIILKDTGLNQTPLIFMVSAFGREEIVQKAEKVGVNSYLMKPVNQSLLFNTIMHAFNRTDLAVTNNRSIRSSDTVIYRFDGVNVLLVEDNLFNQQVATEVLTGLGMEIEIADNGMEAIHKITGNHYDLVLMDVQMPVMDGYEATRQLRKIPQYSALPVVAMTAHAMQGAKEECLAAGMNDYVSKPIDVEQLVEVVSRYITPTVTSAERRQSDEHHRLLPEEILGVDIHSGLKRVNGNESLYLRLLVDFRDKYTDTMEAVHQALEKGDFESAVRFVHTLKGVAGNLSIPGVYRAAHVIEDSIAEKYKTSKPEMDELLDALDRELHAVLDSLDTLKNVMASSEIEMLGTPTNFDPSEVTEQIKELEQLLNDDNIDAVHALESLKKQLGSFASTEIKRLEEQINHYDFDSAKQSLQMVVQGLNLTTR